MAAIGGQSEKIRRTRQQNKFGWFRVLSRSQKESGNAIQVQGVAIADTAQDKCSELQLGRVFAACYQPPKQRRRKTKNATEKRKLPIID